MLTTSTLLKNAMLSMVSILVIILAGCGGGGGGGVVDSPVNAVKGAGIKGPLAHAIVRLYQVDLSRTDLKGSLLDEGVTTSDAAITDLTIDSGLSGLVLLEFVVGANTVEINTGTAPVFDRLATVVDVQRIYDGDGIYATPLTSMAVTLAQANADKGAPYAGNSDLAITTAEFTAALAVAQNQVKSTLGFGLDSSVDIFTVPPILTADTITVEEQAKVVKYRQAIEAIAALADQVARDSSASDTPQEIFDGLTEDLKDGTIDGLNDTTPVTTLAALDTPIDTTLGSLDPTTLVIPNTTTPITDIKRTLTDELATTGEVVDTTPLAAIVINPAPPALVAESNDTYTLGGTMSGLSGTVVLQNNAGDDLTLSASGSFSFATPVVDGNAYSVTVLTQPSGQTCSASSNSGTVSGANVTTVAVTCTTHTYAIGGTLSGLTYLKTVTLQNNGGNNLILNNDGSFHFTTPVAYGSSYDVTVFYASAGLSCTASNNTGTVSANVTDVVVTCTTQTHTVGGSVSGLSGSVVLQNNGGDDLTINTNGSFTFNTAVEYATPYHVTVLTQPAGQTCALSNGVGVMSTTDVTDVMLTCTTNSYTVGGSVSGLSGSVVLQNNGGDDLTLGADGQFAFATSIIHGGSYSVSVLTQPSGQTCVASNNTGTVSGAKVTSVAITCIDNSYTIGGNVSGLSGSVVLQNNGGDDLTVSADGAFTFSTAIINGGSYNVSVLTQPAGQTCTASTNTGSISGANVSNVVVTCSVNSYTIGGTVTGLSGSMVLQNNGGDDLTINANGAFTFATSIADGGSYNVTVLSQPAGKFCSISSNNGAVNGANVSTVSVSCVSAYSIGGTVSGLTGTLVLQNNNGDDLTINADGAFSFNTPVADSGNYSVAVSTQPTNLTCFVDSGSGQVSGADITNVFVFCSSPELDADVISDTVNLDWVDVGASSYNLYYSSASNCDIANYASCANGTMLPNVTPPYTVTGLSVEQNWWFQLESVVTGANGVAQVGVRTSKVSPKGTLSGLQNNIDHGGLYAITHDDSGRTYLGGDFAAMSNVSGHGMVASAARADGVATGHVRAYPVIGGGEVYAAASDGNGGYYIGGSFTTADSQSRSGLAHILPSGELDPYWAPAADNAVYSIAVAGNTVYVGGHFRNIDGISHDYLAAIDTDGNLQTWDPGLDGSVLAMQISGSTLYIGGGFATVGGNARSKLAAIDTTTGNLLSWTPAAVNNGEVKDLVVYNGSVYFGGTFTQVDSTPRNYLAAVDSGGALSTWNPAPDQKVYCLAISGSTIYAGGFFDTIGGTSGHYYLAAIDAVNGTVQNWPTGYSLSIAGSVRTIAAHGGTVYVGGDMHGFNGTARNFVAAYGTDGSLYNWDVAVDEYVYALAADNDTVFVGGSFNLQGGVARTNLAALEADDSLDLNWAPAADDVVEALAVYGNTLYVGGSFTSIDDGTGAQTRNRLAAIGTTDGTLDMNWSPAANGIVHALATDANSTLYAGGAFTNINDGSTYSGSHLAAIDSGGNVLSGWAPVADDDVFAVTVSGNTVYVGGNFNNINSTPRSGVAAIGFDGTLGSWSPIVDANLVFGQDLVSGILVSGSTVYIAGSFWSIDDGGANGVVSIYSLAAVGTDGSLINWVPDPYGEVYDIALSGSTLYAAGQFSAMGADTRNYAAAINTSDGTATSLDPNLDFISYAVDAHNGKVYFGGEFTTQGGKPSPLLTILPE